MRLARYGIPHYIAAMKRIMNATRRPADVARRSAKALAGHVRDAFRRETFATHPQAPPSFTGVRG